VIRDRTGQVPAVPAREPQPPAQVDVLLVHVESLVQVLAADPDGLERLPSGDERRAADAEDFLLARVLTDVLLVLAPVGDAPVASDHVPGRIDDVGLPVPLELISEDLPGGAPCSWAPLEKAHQFIEVTMGDEQVGVCEEDEFSDRRLDAHIDGLCEPGPMFEIENAHAWVSDRRHEVPQGLELGRVVVQQDDFELARGPLEDSRK
jgi:hypothetical protein